MPADCGGGAKRMEKPERVAPLLLPGRRSYEIYLTHMFIVLVLFGCFVRIGSPLDAVPILFITIIGAAILLGELVARLFSEPLNGLLRRGLRGRSRGIAPTVAAAERSV